MVAKSEKCCCCIGSCVNTGSRFAQCTVCTESPHEFFISNWGGRISSVEGQGPSPPDDPIVIFGCCLAVDPFPGGGTSTGMVSRLLVGDRFGSECKWISTKNFCEDASGAPLVDNHWEMEITGLGAGQVYLRLIFDDYRVVVWVNRYAWNCFCRNEFIRNEVLDEGDPDEIAACGIPELICVSPIAPCCPDRTVALPRRLYATLTVTSGSCPCLDGAIVPLDWNPDDGDGKWIWPGTSLIGSCLNDSCKVRIRLWCLRIIGQSTTTWFFDTRLMVPGIDGPMYTPTGTCDPMSLSRVIPDFAGCCGAGPSAVMVTFHE